MAVPTRLLLLFASLASFAACSHPDPYPDTKTRPSALQTCGPDGHVLATAATGDLYQATDPAIQSVVISNGSVGVLVTGDRYGVTKRHC